MVSGGKMPIPKERPLRRPASIRRKGALRGRPSFPIFHRDLVDALEFTHVAGNKRQAARPGLTGDQDVVRAACPARSGGRATARRGGPSSRSKSSNSKRRASMRCGLSSTCWLR